MTSAEVYDSATGAWTLTGAMSKGREGHSATLLSNGKVLVVGGYESDGAYTTAELFDPAVGRWNSTGNILSGSRIGYAAALLPTGKVLLVDRAEGKTPVLFNPTDGTWSSTSPMVVSRTTYPSVTLLKDGRVLVAGGFNSSGGYLASAELFDPATGKWTATGSMATSRTYHAATLLPDGKVLVLGGSSSSGAEVFDPAIGQWLAKGNLLALRWMTTATLLADGRVLVLGGGAWGSDEPSDPLTAYAELFDPLTGTSRLTGAPVDSFDDGPGSYTTTLLPDGRVLIAGGTQWQGEYSVAFAELYDPQLKATAGITLGRLTQAYNGLPRAVTATTSPAGFNVDLTYDGAPDAPTEVGTYVVVGTVNDVEFSGAVTNTLTITATKSVASVLLSNLVQTYTGGPCKVAATTSPSGLQVDLTYNGLPNAPTNAGTYLVVGTINDPDFFGSSTNSLVVQVAKAGVTLGSLSQVYSGSPRSATATTSPPGLRVDFTYNGVSTAPVNAGTYTVIGTVNNPNYVGSATNSLLVGKATGRVILGNLSQIYSGGPRPVTVFSSPAGLRVDVTYSGSTNVPSAAGWYSVSATINDPNYEGSATATLSIFSFLATNSLDTARANHTATLLPNGKVLVVGGEGTNGLLSSAALFNPASGIWTPAGPLSVPRDSHSATLLPNGKVLVVGGGNYLATAELFDPAVGTWKPTGLLITGRRNHTATLLPNGRVLVAGGENFDGYYAGSAEQYDPATGTWTETGPLNFGRAGHVAVLLPEGKVLVAGGYDGSYLPIAELYNPDVGTWTRIGDLASGRAYHAATLLPTGEVLVSGGFGSGGKLSSSELYTPLTGTWRSTGPLGTARDFHTTTLLPDGKVLAVGGTAYYTPAAELYDPTTERWTRTGPLNYGRHAHTATLLPDGKVLIVGGYGEGMPDFGPLSSVELYYPFAKAWATVTLANLSQPYTGVPRSVTATSSPSGLRIDLTYNGTSVPPVAVGTYTVVGTVNDFNYQGSATNVLTIFQPGSLQMLLEPVAAVNAGAQWQVDGGAWQNSGATVTTLAAGSHTVAFKPLAGWTTPASQTVIVNTGQTTTITGTYAEQPGSLTVVIGPEGAVNAGAQWRVDSGAWQNSGSTVTTLPSGTHTVTFSDLAAWLAPAPQVVTLAPGQSETLTALYSSTAGATLFQWSFDGPPGATLVSDTDRVGFATLRRFNDATLPAGSPDTIRYGPPNPWFNTGGTSAEFLNTMGVNDPGTGLFRNDAGTNEPLDLSTLSNLTIEAFVYPYDLRQAVVIRKTSSSYNGFFIDLRSAGCFGFRLNAAEVAVTNTPVRPNAWYHLALVKDGLAGQARFYINGALRTNVPFSDYLPDTPNSLGVGTYARDNTSPPANSGQFFYGLIDEVRICSAALAPSQFLLNQSNTNTQQFGSLQITLSPPGAVNAGALWQLDGGAWHTSGAALTSVPVGQHSVAFAGLTSWIAPSAQKVTVSSGLTTATEAIYQPVNPQEGLVAYYPFSRSARDFSGNALDGVLNGGCGFATDRFGIVDAALELATNHPGFVWVESGLLPKGNEPRTVSVWVKPDFTGMTLWPGGTTRAGDVLSFGPWSTNHQGLYMELKLESGTNFVPTAVIPYASGQYTYAVRPQDDQWHHLALTFDGAVAKLYLDGRTSGGVNLPINTPGDQFKVGLSDRGDEPYYGLIDDLRIYRRALDAAEINALVCEADPPLLILDVFGTANDTLTLQVTGIPGRNCHLEASSDLLTWVEIGQVTSGTNGLASFTDVDRKLNQHRFYRARQ